MKNLRETLGVLWSELLDCDEITDTSDFFECGGTSIAAVHLAALIQENFNVPVDAVEVVVERQFGKIAGLIGERLVTVS